MAEVSKPKECSFFLVRYVPDPVRDEGLNVGLFLHSPQEKYLGCLFTDDLRRVKRMHPQADLELLRELQKHFEQEIDERSHDLQGYIRFMQESYSNLIQVTTPRPCLLNDPQTEIQDLFARYVGPHKGGPPAEDTRLRIKQQLTAAFVRARVWDRLERRVPVEQWTQKGDRFTFDYGYKPLQAEGRSNGHIKFVHALSLKHDIDLAKVLVYTMDYVRRKEPADLTAVVAGPPKAEDEAARLCQRILDEGRVELQPLSGLDDYAQSVRRELLM